MIISIGLFIGLIIMCIHSILQNQKIRKLESKLIDRKNDLILIDDIMQDNKMTYVEKVEAYFWNLNNLPF